MNKIVLMLYWAVIIATSTVGFFFITYGITDPIIKLILILVFSLIVISVLNQSFKEETL